MFSGNLPTQIEANSGTINYPAIPYDMKQQSDVIQFDFKGTKYLK
jgi:hypothetical protein